MPTIEIDNEYKINYNDKGNGKILVFLHGFLASSWVFKAQVD